MEALRSTSSRRLVESRYDENVLVAEDLLRNCCGAARHEWGREVLSSERRALAHIRRGTNDQNKH